MLPAPQLSESEIRAELEQLFRKKHRSKLVALHGAGQPGRFEWDGLPWEIIPTRCELDLRARLPAEPDENAPRRVFLIDWVVDALPLDIACRLAGGRLLSVKQDTRLEALFGARQVDPAFSGSALARLYLSGGLSRPRSVSGLRVGLDEAFFRFLEGQLELKEDAVSSAVALFRWVREQETRRPDLGPGFLKRCDADAGFRAVRAELLAWLGARLAAPGVLAWRAFELGQVDRVIQVGLLALAEEKVTSEFVRGLFKGRLTAWLPELAPELRGALADLAKRGVLAELLDLSRSEDTGLLRATEAMVTEPELRPVLSASEWLPEGHRARQTAFAQAVQSFLGEISVERFASVRSALETLRAHRWERVVSQRERERRTMVARLAAWLCTRKLRVKPPAHGAVWQPAADLATQYSQEGGYVEWARQSARAMGGAPDLDAATRALLGAVEAELRSDDRRFAQAYVEWVRSGKPSGEVLPIEHVASKWVGPFLQQGERKLLVILMDGMSQAAAVQLLAWMSEQARWRRIAWRAPGYKGPLLLPPVLAVAPTLTELSRAAFFAGEADVRFGGQDTSKDVQRWAQNPVVRALSKDVPVPLCLRKELGTGDALHPELQQGIDGDEKLVAVVVNAIDEELKGSTQMAKDYSEHPPRPLEMLLRAADGADRAVLLVADHGHVLADGNTKLTGVGGDGREGGARWRALGAEEVPLPEEVVLPEGCWKPKGAARVAVLWDSRASHKTAHYGEHGGLSLSEAVAPAFLIGPEWLDRVHNDEALRPVELAQLEPVWWQLRVPTPAAVVPAPAVEKTESGQLALLTVRTPVAMPVSQVEAKEPKLVTALRASAAFKAQVVGNSEPDIERALSPLSVLVRAGDVLPTAEFARQCGVKPHQVAGVVARMGILNADGFAIVEHDIAGKRVLLHRARLSQQYGVQG